MTKSRIIVGEEAQKEIEDLRKRLLLSSEAEVFKVALGLLNLLYNTEHVTMSVRELRAIVHSSIVDGKLKGDMDR